MCAMRTFNKGEAKPIHKSYGRKGWVVKRISGLEPRGAWCQDKLIGGKPPVVK
jgi:hypothetical protein